MDFNGIKNKLLGSKDKIEGGLDKAATLAKGRVRGHDDKIDTGVKKAKDLLAKADRGNPPPAAGPTIDPLP